MYLHIGTSGPSFGSARSIVGASQSSVGKEVRPVGRDRFPRNGAGPHDKRVIAKVGSMTSSGGLRMVQGPSMVILIHLLVHIHVKNENEN